MFSFLICIFVVLHWIEDILLYSHEYFFTDVLVNITICHIKDAFSCSHPLSFTLSHLHVPVVVNKTWWYLSASGPDHLIRRLGPDSCCYDISAKIVLTGWKCVCCLATLADWTVHHKALLLSEMRMTHWWQTNLYSSAQVSVEATLVWNKLKGELMLEEGSSKKTQKHAAYSIILYRYHFPG